VIFNKIILIEILPNTACGYAQTQYLKFASMVTHARTHITHMHAQVFYKVLLWHIKQSDSGPVAAKLT